jgi:hypothetical protein|tara:strand:+ start:303 stop:797 length:495 start_codon:yes stop_codon:yes gene_type:complete
MAYKIRSLKEGLEYIGSDLEYIIDDENDVGEVYLDGDLLYQADDIITEYQLDDHFRRNFIIEDHDDETFITEFDKIDYSIDNASTGLFTSGGEYLTQSGKEYIGDYHEHPDLGAMAGKFHDYQWTERDLLRVMLNKIISRQELLNARTMAPVRNIDYTVGDENY